MNVMLLEKYKMDSLSIKSDFCEDMPSRVFDLLTYNVEHYGHKDCLFAQKKNGIWIKWTGEDIKKSVDAVSIFLLKNGVQKGDRIAIMADSNPQWNIIDFAVLQIGAILVPIHLNIGEGDLSHILLHCQPKLIYVKDSMIDRIKSFNITTISASLSDDDFHEDNINTFRCALQEAKRKVSPEDIASIIYTSGTTGTPKGVMLTHHNIMSNIANYANFVPRIDRAVSHLPLSHIFERSVQYTRIYCGISIYYAENQATIVRDVIDVKANSFSTVPRVIEKMYDYVVQTGKKFSGEKRELFRRAIKMADNYDEMSKTREAMDSVDYLQMQPIFEEIRKMFGGELVFISSGGASLQSHLVKFCAAIGSPVVEGYGLTETSPMISIGRLTHGLIRAGSVGHPCPNLDLKIDSKTNEILVKGSSVMKGYYKDEQATRRAFDDEGYFHTGDKGKIDADGFLYITGRINEVFKTSMGKFIVPSVIENTLCLSPFISKALAIGEGKRFVVALIVPDFQQLGLWCQREGGGQTPMIENNLIEDPRVKKLYEKEIAACNKTLGSAECVRRFVLIDRDWTIESGELTPSYKIRRRVIEENNKDLIRKLYGANLKGNG